MLATIAANDWNGVAEMAERTDDRVATEGSRTLVSLAERVAVVETKVGGLKEDTGVIRSTIHDINNRMTEFVAAEIRCGDHLAQLLTMKPHMDRLIEANQQGRGAWRAVGIVGTTLVGAMGIGASIASGLWWLLHTH